MKRCQHSPAARLAAQLSDRPADPLAAPLAAPPAGRPAARLAAQLLGLLKGPLKCPLTGRPLPPLLTWPLAAILGLLLAFPAAALDGDAAAPPSASETLRNWFDDPFFALSSQQPDCPEPAGPRTSEAERRIQAHRRAEKGTTCWLAGEADCQQPSAYRYDAGIAAAIRALAAGASLQRALAGSSVWITVQGRVIYAEGCVQGAEAAKALEQQLRGLPHVQQVIPLLRLQAGAPLPYRPLPKPPLAAGRPQAHTDPDQP